MEKQYLNSEKVEISIINRVRRLISLKILTHAEKRKLLKLLIKKVGAKARRDLYTYAKLMGDEVLPGSFIDGRHVRVVTTILQRSITDIENGETFPLNPTISLPPGSSKSVLCSQLTPTWGLGRNPHWFILAIGHSADFMVDNSGRKAKDIMMSPRYQLLFPNTKIREDVAAAGRFFTTENGMFVCAGWNTNIAGRRATLAILDDVVSEQSAASESELRKIREWFGGGLSSRLLSTASIINLCTRWAPNDLIGYVLEIDRKNKEKRYLEVRFPAINDAISSQILGLPIGESFWPELWKKEVLLDKKNFLSPAKWQCLYLQNPVPEEGSFIQWDWCKRWEVKEPPMCDLVVLSLDTAATNNKDSDPTGFTVGGIFQRQYRGWKEENRQSEVTSIFTLDGGEVRLDYIQMLDFIDDKIDQYGVDLILIEESTPSIMFIQDLQRRGYPVIGVRTKGSKGSNNLSKIDRMLLAQPSFMHGRVWFPKTSWADECISKLCQFPHGKHDDFADSMSMLVNWVQKNYNFDTGNELPSNTYDLDEDESSNISRATYWQTT